MTESEEKEKRANEFNDLTALFSEALDVEEIIAQLLVADGYMSIEKIAAASVEDLRKVEGFDEDIAAEIKARAEEFIETNGGDEEEENEEDENIAKDDE
jgi:N utilization substance protein A